MSTSDHKARRNLWFFPMLCGLFFIIGLWLFFPTQAVQLRLEQELSQQLQRPVSVGSVNLNLPMTMTIASLEANVVPEFTLQLQQLKARPVWSSLLQGQPAVALQGQTLGGTINAQINTERHLQIQASDLHWDQTIPQIPRVRVTTTIEQLTSHGFIDPINQLEQLQLQLTHLVISGIKQFGAPIDQLDLGRIEVQLSQNERQLRIETFTATGGDIDLEGHGNVVLQRNIQRSRLDVTLNLAPSDHLDAALTSLLPLVAKQQNDGRYQLRIGGTLEMPRLH